MDTRMTIVERVDGYCQRYHLENYADAQIFIDGVLAGLALANEFVNPVEIEATGPYRDNAYEGREWTVELRAE